MLCVNNLQTPPTELTDYLRVLRHKTRRRAVLTRETDNNWTLLCCTVDGCPDASEQSEVVPSRRYTNAVLHEDWLTAEDCQKFIDEIRPVPSLSRTSE